MQDYRDLYSDMATKLNGIIPDIELKYKAELVAEIRQLKQEKNMVILGHNYMEPALFHFVPDYTGDSLEISRRAAQADADIIVFCGVKFMAETAKILNPEKTVLLPARKAGCSLAESISADDVRRLRSMYPGVPVVTYINTYADVQAESDICCTSGNAAAVVESLGVDTVIFIPDEYLAKNVAHETGKHIIFPSLQDTTAQKERTDIDVQFIGWRGRCEVHELFSVEDIGNIRRQFPDTVILSHPECSPEVVQASDFTGSTSAMIKFVEQSGVSRYLLLTECSMADNIAVAHPEKELLRLCSIRCAHMNEITLEETRDAIKFERYVVEVPENIRIRAAAAVQRMIAIG